MTSDNPVLEILVFGDSTYNVVADLESLLFQKHAYLDIFFDSAYQAVKDELARLNNGRGSQSVAFTSLQELVALRRDGKCPPNLHQALTVICQLGLFLRSQDDGRVQWFESNVATLGLCTGSLSAAVVSGSNSLQSFLTNAARAVAVATRLGFLTDRVSHELEVESAVQKPWAFLIPGVSVDDVVQKINDFVSAKAVPLLSRPYISAYAPNGVTISGPSNTLDDLRKNVPIFNSRGRDIGLFAAYHAPHLYTEADLDWILAAGGDGPWCSRSTKIPSISSISGKQIWTGSFRPLLRHALTACLTQPLRFDHVHAELPSTLRSQGATKLELVSFGSDAAQSLQRSLTTLDDSVKLTVYTALPTNEAQRSCDDSRKIAIIGMSGRFPEAENTSEFWELLAQGLDVCQEAPPTRWDVKTHVDLTGKTKNASAVPWGCWLQNAGLYDPRFFGISPKEAAQCDPQQRLASMAAYEAMEEAGLVVGRTPSTQKDRIGVFLGSTGCDWFETNSAQDISTFFIPGGNRAFTPGRINYVFNLCGPSYSIDTACSSSLAAIHLACNSIWKGDCDTAITGGTNMTTNPDATTGLDRGFFLSRTGNCKTFDDGADGYCRGEAAGVLILKRLNEAIADKDPIRGVILDINTNHSAESEAIVRPHAGAQSVLMKKVLGNAGVHPHDVSYVEMHGTGTQAGDAVEMESVLSVFADKNASPRDGEHSLFIGSVKPNIGHGEGASGASALIKVLLMMEHNKIPPHVGIKTKINHNFPVDLDERHVHIARSMTPWTSLTGRKRRVLVNNFSAAGGNSALLLEDAPASLHSSSGEHRSSQVLATSAKCATSLRANLENMINFIKTKDRNDTLLLSQLSYTTTSRRSHYPFRLSFCVSNLHELTLKVEEAIANDSWKTRSLKKPAILMAFTGQGAQYSGMGHQLYRGSSVFRSAIQHFDRLSQRLGFPGFLSLFTDENTTLDGLEPVIVQLATVALEIALARLLQALGLHPTAVIGHSLGQYAALNVAHVLSDSDTIFLVGTRARLLQEQCSRGTHSMLAVKAGTQRIGSLLTDKTVNIACINGPEATVLAGNNRDVKEWQQVLVSNKIQTKILDTDYAFHSSQTDPILSELDLLSAGVTLGTPSVPVICPLESGVITKSTVFGQSYFSRHSRQPVNILSAVNSAQTSGLIGNETIVIEVGPHPTVSSMIKSVLGSQTQCHYVLAKHQDSWKCLGKLLVAMYNAGIDVRWDELHVDQPSAQRVLKLPSYAWDLKNYWLQYTGDWSLRKGMSIADIKKAFPDEIKEASSGLVSQSPPSGPAVAKIKQTPSPEPPVIESTTVHRIIGLVSDQKTAEIVVEANIARNDLYSIAQGHKVNGVPLCTPSVYAEIAQTVGKYLIDRFRPNQVERLVDVAKLVVERPLIPLTKTTPLEAQLIRCTLTIDWAQKSGKCLFVGIDKHGKTHTEYAWCEVLYKDTSRLAELQETVPDIKERMQTLVNGVADGTSTRFSGPAAYKMVGTLASFHPDFRGVKENILDSNSLEVLATLDFSKIKRDGTFITHPAVIDAMTQPGGFVMNAKDSTDLEKEVYVNHGWDSFQIYDPISLDKTYKAYTKMTSLGNSLWSGNSYVFESDTLVAFFEGITLKKMPRKAFHMILNWTTRQEGSKGPVKSTTTASSTENVLSPALHPDSENLARQSPQVELVKKDVIPKEQAPDVQHPSQSSKCRRALEIVADETGVAIGDLTEGSTLVDIGMDSLLSMVVANRFQEELDLNFDEEMALFTNFPTIGALTKHISSLEKPDTAVVNRSLEQPRIQSVSIEASGKAATGTQSVVLNLGTSTSQPTNSSLELFDRTLEMISEESGVALTDLTEDTAFVDVGIDSLLSMVITSRLREELGFELEEDTMLFTDFPKVVDLRRWIEKTSSDAVDTSPDTSSEGSHSSGSSTPQTSDDETWKPEKSIIITTRNEATSKVPRLKRDGTCKAATSVILQGRPAKASKTLFLFPDGGGSASSYLPLQRLGDSIAVVGLNCPYARDPENMTCDLEELMASYIKELKRRQPIGPYNLGGWSSGAVFAFVASKMLTTEGEVVESLVLIDAPPPGAMDALPTDFFDWAEQLRNAAKTNPPSYLVPHFKATTEIMVGYDAKPLDSSVKVLIIWASKGMMTGKDIPRYQLPPGASSTGLGFLLDDKTDLGARGWDELLPSGQIQITTVDGANHFTLMSQRHGNEKYVKQVAAAISSLLS